MKLERSLLDFTSLQVGPRGGTLFILNLRRRICDTELDTIFFFFKFWLVFEKASLALAVLGLELNM